MLSKSFQNEHEALKIKFIIFYVIVFLGYEMIGITAVDNSNDCYEFDFYDYGIKYLSVWDLSTDSLLNLPQNTILMIQ